MLSTLGEVLQGNEVDELRQRLLAQAFLYDDPEAYVSGVEAALRAVERLAPAPPAVPRSLSSSAR